MREVLGEVLAREQGELVEWQRPGRAGGTVKTSLRRSRVVTRSSRRASSSLSAGTPRNVNASGDGRERPGSEREDENVVLDRASVRERGALLVRIHPDERTRRSSAPAASTSRASGNRRTSPTWNGSATANGR